jgi:hypothetical protein
LGEDRSGNGKTVAVLEVPPRPTSAERFDAAVDVVVDEALTVHAATIEDWVAPRQAWEFMLREGTNFDRANNVEAELLFVMGEQTSSLTFRLEQLEIVRDEGEELVLVFDERDGIAKLARLTANGLDVELFHILTFP